jgi:hypothetical protein
LPGLRATTIHAFLDSKEFEELERAAKHFNGSKSEREVQTRTPNTALVAAQQLDFDRSHSATSHNPYRYSRYIRGAEAFFACLSFGDSFAQLADEEEKSNDT